MENNQEFFDKYIDELQAQVNSDRWIKIAIDSNVLESYVDGEIESLMVCRRTQDAAKYNVPAVYAETPIVRGLLYGMALPCLHGWAVTFTLDSVFCVTLRNGDIILLKPLELLNDGLGFVDADITLEEISDRSKWRGFIAKVSDIAAVDRVEELFHEWKISSKLKIYS